MRPLWAVATDALLHVRAVGADDSESQNTFDLWRIPGRKRLAHAGTHLVLTSERGPHRVRATLSTELSHGVAYGLTVPLDAHLRTRMPDYQAQAGFLGGDALSPGYRSPSRAGLMHLHALQALDALLAQAHHRDIAVALFGEGAVRARWTRDGELRAQLRHVLARAEGLMRCDYLRLAGIRPERAPMRCRAGGDETAH